MLVHTIIKNALEEIRIEISTYEGKKYLNLRVWFDASKGQGQDWQPSQKGITFSIDLLQQLKEGIDKAAYLTIQGEEFPERKEEDHQLNLPEPGPETKKSKKKKREPYAGEDGEIPF